MDSLPLRGGLCAAQAKAGHSKPSFRHSAGSSRAVAPAPVNGEATSIRGVWSHPSQLLCHPY